MPKLSHEKWAGARTSRVLLPRARLRLAMQPAAALAAMWKAFTLCFVRMTCEVAPIVSSKSHIVSHSTPMRSITAAPYAP